MAYFPARCYNACVMADWRQIQARIRKARNSADPIAKLSELYQRTHDGMVAWELGVVGEKGGRSDEAVKWYKVAAEKFRRADWKKKAEEALTRLGVQPPAQTEGIEGQGEQPSMSMEDPQAQEDRREPAPLAMGEIQEEEESGADDAADGVEEVEGTSTPDGQAVAGTAGDAMRKKRRRGRRGGRGRRRKGATSAEGGLPAQAYASAGSPAPVQARPVAQPISAASSERVPYEPPVRRSPPEPRPEAIHLVPQLPSERAAHGRSDPGLSSRMAHLESLLRRLLNSPLHNLGDADEAPAGPGVFLLSDVDQTNSYYIEACQTLRVGVGNLGRSGRSSPKATRGGRAFTESNFKEKFSEHLGINEAKVSQYLKDHCVVRWIQLDDEAAHLAHFAIGLLRTPLNSD
jgi:hypothetical protein